MTKTRTISTSELKARVSEVLEGVQHDRIPVVVTKRGRVIARIIAADDGEASLYGSLRGSVTVHGDLLAPVEVEWEAT
jgi:prevent-host-death family protein